MGRSVGQLRWRILAWVVCTAVPTVACEMGTATPPSQGDSATVDGDGVDAGDAAVGTRSFALASTGLQAQIGSNRLYHLTPADLATDVDVIAIHQDFYGLPWDTFATDAPPPAAWVSIMQGLADAANSTGKDIFLSVALAGGPGRAFLSDKASEEGGNLVVAEGWSARCYNFDSAPDGAAMRAAYLRYLTWMADLFTPTHFNIAIEMNLFAARCDAAAWNALVNVQNEGYAALGMSHPDTVVFPSFVLEHLYGVAADACPAPQTVPQCYAGNLDAIAGISRDRFAVSTYPYGVPTIASVTDIPADWFSRVPVALGERLVVAETGWNSRDIVAFDGADCLAFRTSTPSEQVAYFDRLVAESDAGNTDLLTWWSNRDVLPAQVMDDCPCTFDPGWCAVVDVFRTALGGTDPAAQYVGEVVFKFWGSMGLRDYDGNPKSTFMQRWQQVRAIPIGQ